MKFHLLTPLTEKQQHIIKLYMPDAIFKDDLLQNELDILSGISYLLDLPEIKFSGQLKYVVPKVFEIPKLFDMITGVSGCQQVTVEYNFRQLGTYLLPEHNFPQLCNILLGRYTLRIEDPSIQEITIFGKVYSHDKRNRLFVTYTDYFDLEHNLYYRDGDVYAMGDR